MLKPSDIPIGAMATAYYTNYSVKVNGVEHYYKAPFAPVLKRWGGGRNRSERDGGMTGIALTVSARDYFSSVAPAPSSSVIAAKNGGNGTDSSDSRPSTYSIKNSCALKCFPFREERDIRIW